MEEEDRRSTTALSEEHLEGGDDGLEASGRRLRRAMSTFAMPEAGDRISIIYPEAGEYHGLCFYPSGWKKDEVLICFDDGDHTRPSLRSSCGRPPTEGTTGWSRRTTRFAP